MRGFESLRFWTFQANLECNMFKAQRDEYERKCGTLALCVVYGPRHLTLSAVRPIRKREAAQDLATV